MKEMSRVEFKKKLALKIFELRTALGLTQEELSHKLGKDKQIINRYEVEGANPTAHNLVQLAYALGVSVSELLDFSTLTPEENK